MAFADNLKQLPPVAHLSGLKLIDGAGNVARAPDNGVHSRLGNPIFPHGMGAVFSWLRPPRVAPRRPSRRRERRGRSRVSRL